MARKHRYHLQAAFYHIMLRGNNGQNIFFDNWDRCRLCLLIQEGIERYGHRIHAFCFMTNHIHLLMQVGHLPISKIVHNLAFRYSQGFNRRYGTTGHLFQGRFKAILIEEHCYFKRLLRYIHMNPVRAGLVKEPTDYQWSGHKVYLEQEAISWLTTEYALEKFDTVLNQARKQYNDYVLEKESEEELNELRAGFKDGHILGNNDFLKNLREKDNLKLSTAIPLSVILQVACDVFDTERAQLASLDQTRKLSLTRGAIVTYAQENGITLEELALIFDRDSSTLSSLKKRFLMKYNESDNLKKKLEQLKRRSLELADLQA